MDNATDRSMQSAEDPADQLRQVLLWIAAIGFGVVGGLVPLCPTLLIAGASGPGLGGATLLGLALVRR